MLINTKSYENVVKETKVQYIEIDNCALDSDSVYDIACHYYNIATEPYILWHYKNNCTVPYCNDFELLIKRLKRYLKLAKKFPELRIAHVGNVPYKLSNVTINLLAKKIGNPWPRKYFIDPSPDMFLEAPIRWLLSGNDCKCPFKNECKKMVFTNCPYSHNCFPSDIKPDQPLNSTIHQQASSQHLFN